MSQPAPSKATERIRNWKLWERGAPALAIEIVSESDTSEASWRRKLKSYRQLGVQELVRFDPNSSKRPFRIWDRVEGALSERDISGRYSPSLLLDLSWTLAPADGMKRAAFHPNAQEHPLGTNAYRGTPSGGRRGAG